MKMRKSNIVTIVRIILIAAVLVLQSFAIVRPRNGRKFTVHIIEIIVLQADPPAKKLLKYMNEKYKSLFRIFLK